MAFKMFLSLRVHRRPQKYSFWSIKRTNPRERIQPHMFWGYKRISKEFSEVIFVEIVVRLSGKFQMTISAISQWILEDDFVCPLQVF